MNSFPNVSDDYFRYHRLRKLKNKQIEANTDLKPSIKCAQFGRYLNGSGDILITHTKH